LNSEKNNLLQWHYINFSLYGLYMFLPNFVVLPTNAQF